MEITLAETNKTKYGYIGIVQVTISIYFNIYLCSAQTTVNYICMNELITNFS